MLKNDKVLFDEKVRYPEYIHRYIYCLFGLELRFGLSGVNDDDFIE